MQPPKVFYKRKCTLKFCNIHRKTPVLCNKGTCVIKATLLAGNFLTKTLPHKYFTVLGNIAKFLKTYILKEICERLLLNFIDSKWK